LLSPAKANELINRFNVLHFQGRTFRVFLIHREHGYPLELEAVPVPSTGQSIKALWSKQIGFPDSLEFFRLASIMIPGQENSLEVSPEKYVMDQDMIQFTLPPEIHTIMARSRVRHLSAAQGLQATLIQHSARFPGELLDFSSQSMRIRLSNLEQHNVYWINPEHPVTVLLSRGERTIYSGRATVTLRASGDVSQSVCVVTPTEASTPRFRPKKFRARREVFRPAPDFVFTHPLLDRTCALKIESLSSLGFSVSEDLFDGVLVPGMIIEDAALSFANSLRLPCRVQVVNRTSPEIEPSMVGIAIIGIEQKDHLKLISMVQQANDPNAYISNEVDPDALFEFFFQTGFLYPHKYIEIAANRETFRQSYQRLYREDSNIARHFVYQSKGKIVGHMSKLRVYDRTWLSHHHAALGNGRAGIKVLRNLSEYISEAYFLNPDSLRYILGVYRPDNKFPERFFSGFVRSVADKSLASVDTFAYISQAGSIPHEKEDLPGNWRIARARNQDLADFRGYYEQYSGGLLAKAFDLTPASYQNTNVSEAFKACGFKRERSLYAVRHNRSLKALIEIQDTDSGLNLSELTNATMVYVLDSMMFDRRMFSFILGLLTTKHQKQKHPVMVYPATYASEHEVPIDKQYNVWALNIEDSNAYLEWMYRFCRGGDSKGHPSR